MFMSHDSWERLARGLGDIEQNMIDRDWEQMNDASKPQVANYTAEPKKVLRLPASSCVSSLASVGTPGEDPRNPNPPNHGVTIGERCTVREFATINGGIEASTVVGDDCYIMAKSHVGHDCVLGDGVKLRTGVILGGHTRVHEGADVGLGAITHPRVTIGAYAFVGMGSVVTRDVPPFAMVYGSPAKQHGHNVVGMRRAGFSEEAIGHIESGGELPRYRAAFDADKGRHKP